MDRASYQAIAERYLDSVFRVALSYCKCREDAEDAVQNAFYKLLITDKQWESEEHIYRWLTKVAINECKSLGRSFMRRKTVSLDAYCEDTGEEPESGEETEKGIFARQVWEAVMRLPSKYSVVLHLHYKEGFRVEDIAEILNLTTANVTVRLHRGRTKLREKLKKGDWLP